MKRQFAVFAVVLLLTACQPVEQDVEPLPTLFPSPTPPAFTLDEAERTASAFLYGWQNSDYASMHGLTNFLSRDATPLEDFSEFYEDAAETMTLRRVSVQPRAISRDPSTPRVAVMTYDATFETQLVGTFTDPNRELTLVFDDGDGAWRVAWSPADLFAEMEQGANLRLLTTPVNRANIYDRNGVVLAMQDDRLIVTVNVVRRSIRDEVACLETLSEAANLPVDVMTARLNNTPPDWVNEVALIEPQAYTAHVTALEDHCAASFGNKSARRYPNGSLMPQILGTVGYVDPEDVPAIVAEGFPQDTILGRSGIERTWDSILRGKPKAELVLEQSNGTRLRMLTSSPSHEAQALWLTIDTGLQQRILEMLSRAYADNAEGWGRISKGGTAIVMDVHTGEILAMVSYPTYDGNAFTPYPSIGRQAALDIIEKTGTDPRLPLLNRATQGRYPSGSTMKIGTSMAVAESGVYSVNTRFSCSGSWTRNGITRTDWYAPGHGTLDLAGAITNSCNPYFYEAGYQMNLHDPFLMPTMLRHFGLGQPTGLTDIPEDSGSIGDPDTYRIKTGLQWSFVDAVSMAIGQGEVEVTPLQMLRLAVAVANGGDLLKPYLVQKAGLFSDFSYIAQPETLSRLDVRDEVIKTVRDGMCDVTIAYTGTATHIFVDSPLLDLGVCGKTGTAQNLLLGTTHAWFVGYAPREDPEIAVVVMIEDAGEGSAVAAPLVRDIMEYYFFGESQMRVLRGFLRIAAIVLITVALLEGAMRLFAPRLPGSVGVVARYITTGQPYSEAWQPAWRENRDHYYTLRPNISDALQYGSPSVPFHLTTHKLWDDGLAPDEGIGFRTAPVDFGVDAVVVGDSFGFCFTEQADCWVDQWAAQSGLQVVNLSTPVTGSLSHARMVQDFAAPLEPPLVVWQFFGNDFYDDYALRVWRGDIEQMGSETNETEQGSWFARNLVIGGLVELLTTGTWSGLPAGEKAYEPQFRAPYPGGTLMFGKTYELKALDMSKPQNQYGYEQTRQALSEAKVAVESWGGELVVVMIPTREEVYSAITEPVMGLDNLVILASARDAMNTLCRELDLTCLDPTGELALRGQNAALYYADDMHMNPAGNTALAGILSDWLESLKDGA